MITFLVVIHVTVSIALIVIVLLQSGKGAEMGASFGTGGSQSLFGAGGGGSFISKVTTGAAVIFMLTSLTLAYFSGKPETSSIMRSKVSPQTGLPQQKIPLQPLQGQPANTPPTLPQQAPRK